MEPVRFYLDFVSTYSYFAADRIDAVAARHGRSVDWRVVSLPHVFKAAGTTSPLEQPLKLAHNQQDTARLAAMTGLPFARPPGTPDVQAARLVFHRLRLRDAALAARFVRQAMALRFGQGCELNTPAALAAAAEGLAVNDDELQAAAHDPAARQSLIDTTAAAVADGMFGAPFACIGGQRFWGHDRVVDHLDWWLAKHPS